MGRFLVEIPHSDEATQCTGIVKVFLSSGSHLLTNAEWGCQDGVHTGWLIVEVDSKEEALSIVPSAFRSYANVVELNSFTLDFINSEIERLEGEAAS